MAIFFPTDNTTQYRPADSTALTFPNADWAIGFWIKLGDPVNYSTTEYRYPFSANNFGVNPSVNITIMNFSSELRLNVNMGGTTTEHLAAMKLPLHEWVLVVCQRRSNNLDVFYCRPHQASISQGSTALGGTPAAIDATEFAWGGRVDRNSARYIKNGALHAPFIVMSSSFSAAEVTELGTGKRPGQLATARTTALEPDFYEALGNRPDLSANAISSALDPSNSTQTTTAPGPALIAPGTPVVIAATGNSRVFKSPGTWVDTGSVLRANNLGAYLKGRFSGRRLTLRVDQTAYEALNVAQSAYPILRVQIDGGKPKSIQLPKGTAKPDMLLASGLELGVHTYKVWLQGGPAPTDQRANPPAMRLDVEAFLLDSGETLSAPAHVGKRALAFGDSNIFGFTVVESNFTDHSYNNNGAITFVQKAAERLGWEIGTVGFAGQGWRSGTNQDNAPAFHIDGTSESWRLNYTGTSRLPMSEAPDVVIVNHGANDGGATDADVTASVTSWLTDARAEWPKASLLIIPHKRQVTKVAAVIAGVNNYRSANPGDTNVYLMNLGTAGSDIVANNSSDGGTHMNARGHQLMGDLLANRIKGALPLDSANLVGKVQAGFNRLAKELKGKASSSVVTDHVAATDPHTQYQRKAEKGALNGYASLGGDGKVPAEQLPPASGGTIGNDVPSALIQSGTSLALPTARPRLFFSTDDPASLGVTPADNELWFDVDSFEPYNVLLTTDVTNNHATANTIQDVTGLQFNVVAGARYHFRFYIPYTAAASTTGSRWSINGPSVTSLFYESEYTITATTRTLNEGQTAYNLPSAANASSIVAGNTAKIEGVIQPSAAGTVIARFASEVASSAIVAKAGAFVTVTRLA